MPMISSPGELLWYVLYCCAFIAAVWILIASTYRLRNRLHDRSERDEHP